MIGSMEQRNPNWGQPLDYMVLYHKPIDAKGETFETQVLDRGTEIAKSMSVFQMKLVAKHAAYADGDLENLEVRIRPF